MTAKDENEDISELPEIIKTPGFYGLDESNEPEATTVSAEPAIPDVENLPEVDVDTTDSSSKDAEPTESANQKPPVSPAETAPANESASDLVGRIVDHIMTTKKLMEDQGGPFESIVPLIDSKKQMSGPDMRELYEVLNKEPSPSSVDEYPYYKKSQSGDLIEGTQVGRSYNTRIPFVRVVETLDKGSGSLMEAHIVVGPITK